MSIRHGNSIKNILSFWSQIAEINSKLGKNIAWNKSTEFQYTQKFCFRIYRGYKISKDKNSHGNGNTTVLKA